MMASVLNEYSNFGSVIIITNGTLVLMIFFLWSGDLGHFSDQVKLVEKMSLVVLDYTWIQGLFSGNSACLFVKGPRMVLRAVCVPSFIFGRPA